MTGADRAQVLIAKAFPCPNVFDDEQRTAKRPAFRFGGAQAVVNPSKRFFSDSDGVDHAFEFPWFERKLAVRSRMCVREGEMFFDDAGAQTYRRHRHRRTERMVG